MILYILLHGKTHYSLFDERLGQKNKFSAFPSFKTKIMRERERERERERKREREKREVLSNPTNNVKRRCTDFHQVFEILT